MPDSYRYSEAEHQDAIVAFGVMLRRWRERNGWTQYTVYQWAKQAGFTAMAPSTLSVLENAKAPKPRPETFFAIAEANRRLANGEFDGLKDPKLKALVVQGAPLRGDDGKLWGPADFWSCHVGLLPPPSAFR